MKKEYSWDEYYQLITSLAKSVSPQIHEYDQLMCLARGGMFMGDAFSRIFNLPLAIMFTSSYRINEKRGDLFIDNQIAKQTNELGKKILLLDDLVDSGVTMGKVVVHLKQELELEKIHTATIWKKKTSVFTPDYFVEEVEDQWIIQPFETVSIKA